MLLSRLSNGRKSIQLLVLAAIIGFFWITLRARWPSASRRPLRMSLYDNNALNEHVPTEAPMIERFKPEKITPLPEGKPLQLPRIQYQFATETSSERVERTKRASAVKETFLRAYDGYKKHAWAKDELAPVTGGYKTPFCGWAATLVDSLDTMHIMGMYDEFEEALQEVGKIDFTGTKDCMINLFEVTIRHLGGLLAAYDISGGKHDILLKKAVELGEILYTAFDTPNRMPCPHYTWSATNGGAKGHEPSSSVVLAVLGTLQLEFTRLSQLTADDKYYSAVQRVMDEMSKWQNQTGLPGMWPAMVDSSIVGDNLSLGSATPNGVEEYTLGARADSAYEYLPKQYMMLGGLSQQGRQLYENFVEVAREHLFFRPMTLNEEDILISGTIKKAIDGGVGELETEAQHLTCFIGGLLAVAGKIFDREEDLRDGAKLAAGCVWAYKSTPTGIMPETFTAFACKNNTKCLWDETKWRQAVVPGSTEQEAQIKINQDRLPPGFVSIQDGRYLLRPEAIESVFILYRITGDKFWYQAGWDMFRAIQSYTKSVFANSAIDDVTSFSPSKTNEMESFWLAETLKYFYLLFSEPNVISLDDYVLNTEAHPLRRPQ